MSEIDPKLSRLYREASNEAPPPALDAAILAAARERAAKPRSRALSSWWRWMAPASAIATLVLGVSLALLIERERPETAGEVLIRQTPPPTETRQPAHETVPQRPEAAAPAAPRAAKKEAPAAFALPPAVPRAEQPYAAERGARTAPPATPAPKAVMESNVADSVSGAAPAAAGRPAPLAQESVRRSPEAWLEEIVRLKQAGREREAAEQLAEFRKAYPAHALPESLMQK